MSLASQLDRYLAVRRSLGYDLRTSERVLRRFIRFADDTGAKHVDPDLFLRWDASQPIAGSSTRSARLGMVRLFALWLSSVDPAHAAPPRGLLPDRTTRKRPYIYSEAEIGGIIAAASELPSTYGMRGLTCSTFFGLIAVTGLRISEALALDTDDLDAATGVLRVRHGKLGKERLLPLNPTVVDRLTAYTTERDRLLGRAPGQLFVRCNGDRLSEWSARASFARVSRTIGLREYSRFKLHGKGPRIHDLRHTFAVRTMIDWYRTGKDPAREMIKLTTWLGHANPDHTFWYI